MTGLSKYSEMLHQSNLEQQQMLVEVRQKLEELTYQLHKNQQLLAAQNSAENDYKIWLDQGKKHFKEIAALYPTTVYEDIIDDLKAKLEEATDTYEENKKNSKYLISQSESSVEVKEIVEDSMEDSITTILTPVIETLFVEPELRDDGYLSVHGIETQLHTLQDDVMAKLASMAGIRARNPLSIAKQLETLNLSADALERMIATASSLIPKPLNGKQLSLSS